MEGRDGEDGLPVEDALARGAAVGVPRIVQIGCDLDGARWAVDAANRYDEIVAGVALHPNEAPRLVRDGDETALDDASRRSTGSPPTRGCAPWARPDSTTSVRARRAGRFSTGRSARTSRWPSGTARRWSSTTATRTTTCCASWPRRARPTGSCCTASPVTPTWHASACERGYWLSFAGTVTFKNAGGPARRPRGHAAEHLLVETDAPFLTPTPYRGRPNASYLDPAHAPRDGGGQAGPGRRARRWPSPPTPTAPSTPGETLVTTPVIAQRDLLHDRRRKLAKFLGCRTA